MYRNYAFAPIMLNQFIMNLSLHPRNRRGCSPLLFGLWPVNTRTYSASPQVPRKRTNTNSSIAVYGHASEGTIRDEDSVTITLYNTKQLSSPRSINHDTMPLFDRSNVIRKRITRSFSELIFMILERVQPISYSELDREGYSAHFAWAYL